MPLHGPKEEDLRKLHSEASQIVNQKFLITTATITVWGFLAAQLLSSQANMPVFSGSHEALATHPLGWAGYFGPILLNLVVLVMFFYSTILAGMLRVITTYLLETGRSGWEADWARYRRLGHLGYTRAQSVVFLFLAAVASAFPFAFALLRDASLEPASGLITHLVIAALTMASIVSLGVLGWPDLEADPGRKWRRLRDAPAE